MLKREKIKRDWKAWDPGPPRSGSIGLPLLLVQGGRSPPEAEEGTEGDKCCYEDKSKDNRRHRNSPVDFT